MTAVGIYRSTDVIIVVYRCCYSCLQIYRCYYIVVNFVVDLLFKMFKDVVSHVSGCFFNAYNETDDYAVKHASL